MKAMLSEVCKLTNEFVKQGWVQSDAMKQAWLNAKTRNALHNGITHFFYRKKDGSIREAFGHTMDSQLPDYAKWKLHLPQNKAFQNYWDITVQEANKWRKYKKEDLISLCKD